MKNIATFLSLLLISSLSFAQSEPTKEMLAAIKWLPDDNGGFSYTRIIEIPGASKDEMYDKALNYLVGIYQQIGEFPKKITALDSLKSKNPNRNPFRDIKSAEGSYLYYSPAYTYVQPYLKNYRNEAPIEIQDKKLGRIIFKGTYMNIYDGDSFVIKFMACFYTLQVDVKEGRVRTILTLTDYLRITTVFINFYKIKDLYPVNTKDKHYKKTMGKAFVNSAMAAMASLDAVEEAVKKEKPAPPVPTVQDDW